MDKESLQMSRYNHKSGRHELYHESGRHELYHKSGRLSRQTFSVAYPAGRV